MAARLKEASKLGFTQALTPRWRAKTGSGGIAVRELAAVSDLFDLFPSDRSPESRAVGM
jgi:predicted ATP-dependent serine protease